MLTRGQPTSLLLAVIFLALLAISGWEVVSTDGPKVVERRARGDGFIEVRVSTVTDIRPIHVANAFWARRTPASKAIKKYELIRQDDVEKIVYQQLRLPIVKDRDYTVRIERYTDAAAGLYQFNSKCRSDLGPPPNDEHVRVTDCTAQYSVELGADGRTHVTYTAFANAAGRLPIWIVNALAPKAASEVLDKMLEEARGLGPI